jgi:hypothetical protein
MLTSEEKMKNATDLACERTSFFVNFFIDKLNSLPTEEDELIFIIEEMKYHSLCIAYGMAYLTEESVNKFLDELRKKISIVKKNNIADKNPDGD